MGRMSDLHIERQEAMGLERQILTQQLAVSALIADCELMMRAGVIQGAAANTLRDSIARIKDAFEPGALD